MARQSNRSEIDSSREEERRGKRYHINELAIKLKRELFEDKCVCAWYIIEVCSDFLLRDWQTVRCNMLEHADTQHNTNLTTELRLSDRRDFVQCTNSP